jgi:hypothetical protein
MQRFKVWHHLWYRNCPLLWYSSVCCILTEDGDATLQLLVERDVVSCQVTVRRQPPTLDIHIMLKATKPNEDPIRGVILQLLVSRHMDKSSCVFLGRPNNGMPPFACPWP